MSVTAAERMRIAAGEIWESCLEHPFVKGIGDGTLPVEKFRFYMLQDYLYLYEYARVFALGVVKARDRALMCDFARHVDTILGGEMNVHRAYMERLGITQEQATAAKPALGNISYTNYMLSAAHSGTPAEIVACILACSWSYAEIGERLAAIPGATEHPFYGEWIASYASEGYAAANRELIGLMNALAKDAPEEQIEYLTEIFVNCCRYEQGFWDMAWKSTYEEVI